MKKSSLILALVATFLMTSVSWARICFLGDTSCQDVGFAGFAGSDSQCDGERSTCEAKNYTTCTDSRGIWYEEIGCKQGYCDMRKLQNYTCDGANLVCQDCCKAPKCASGFKECDSEVYDLVESEKTGTCQELDPSTCTVKDLEIKYKECVCKQDYKYTCEGLSGALECGGKYKQCVCPDGYDIQECDAGYEDKIEATAENGLKNDCYKCKTLACNAGEIETSSPTDTSQCPYGIATFRTLSSSGRYCMTCRCGEGRSDFNHFWSKYYAEPSRVTETCAAGTGKIEYNCEALGYPTEGVASGTKCSDGTEPFRCPFDHTQVYCASGVMGIAVDTPSL